MNIELKIEKRTWIRRGHGGYSTEADYTVSINGAVLRTFSTHGSMTEGYWGNRAAGASMEYATGISKALDNCTIVEVDIPATEAA